MPKKVTFALQPTIIILKDSEDRKGPWEVIALDRYRFNHRIKTIEKKIGWCFKPLHREKIFKRIKDT